jgi:hypothetical protein
VTQSVYHTIDSAQEQLWRTLIADLHGDRVNGGKLSTADAVLGYKSHFNVDFSQSNPWSHLKAEEKTAASRYTSIALRACYRRKYIATENGRVGLAPQNCRLGDVICVFLGASVLSVLRPNDAGATAFSFIGDCFVLGLMNSEALDMLDAGELQERDFEIT